MAGLDTAASVIAVIELSAKVSLLCLEYYDAVKNAKSDIKRLCGELDRLKITIEGAQNLLESPNGARLSISQQLRDGLAGCFSQLTGLQTRLEQKLHPGTRQKLMRHFGRSALKWPFESKDVDKLVSTLERYRDTLAGALIIDQTSEILSMSKDLVLSKLPTAKYAAFDSHADEHDARCHPQTRVDLRKEIIRWADNPHGECIFWLNGMAGTGKSTISRTLAQSFDEQKCLGASFFFKRGERDRGDAALLFTSIASQLCIWAPTLAPHVRAAIEADPAITGKALKEQFERLILEPLGKLQEQPVKRRKIILVIDALDECERDDDIRLIVYLLSRTKALSSVHVRAFVTSRPEVPIRLGFNGIKGKYQDLVLHDIPEPVIEHDISVFLVDKLERIRHDYNSTCREERRLPPDWPESSVVKSVVQMAIPLFIFAATVCRFIEDKVWSDPAEQLSKILQYQSRSQRPGIDKLDATYRPILGQLIAGQSTSTQRALTEEFRKVVGSIVLLAEALSISSVARLLDIPEATVDRRLECLHSVLNVPSSTKHPVRMFHLSFRDFLVDPEKRDNPFWVDEKATHEQIAAKSLELLSSSGHLKRDICDLKRLGATRAGVTPSIIESCLPSEIRYACLYWVHHLEQSRAVITDDHAAYKFLKQHFLHWLEALSLLGKISDCISMINNLQAFTDQSAGLGMTDFLHDANRFVLNYRSIIDLCPLQLYASAIVFTPQESVVRRLFETYVPKWILLSPKVDLTWDACLQTLEGHGASVIAVAFSPDGKTVASASYDKTVRLWDAATGEVRQTLEGHSASVIAVAFSPDGKTVASASYDETVRLWDAATGEARQTLKGHSNTVSAVVFSPDSKTVASVSNDNTIRLWDAATGEARQTLKGHRYTIIAVAFSPDGKTVASVSYDSIVRLWDVVTGEARQTLEGYGASVIAVAFSPDGKIVASASNDNTIIRLWDVTTGKARQTLKGHGNTVSAIVFSPDGKTVASASFDCTVRLWDAATGKARQTFKGHSNTVNAVAFSPDGKTVSSASNDSTVRLWDVATGKTWQTPKGHSKTINAIVFSPDGKTVASASDDNTVRLWDAATGKARQTLKGHSLSINAVAFSPDSKTVASASYDKIVRLWDAATGGAR